jgi:very-short-patch-repair endonuclease
MTLGGIRARRQHGVVTREQLRGLGISARQVDGALARGELRPLHRGVYLVGPLTPPHAREIAAVLACGAHAAISHRSASYLYGLLPYPAQLGPIDVTIKGRHTGRHPGIRLHRTATLSPHEIRERRGIPVTAPPRTVIDLAGCCTPLEPEEAVAEAFALRLTNRTQLLRAISDRPGRRGIARLRRLLDGGPKRTRSVPERHLLSLLRAAKLPEPETNFRVAGWEVDLDGPGHRLVVEVDGYAAHSSPRAFERDRHKDAELTALGLTVRRFSARQVRNRPGAVVAWVSQALGPA